MHQFFPSVSRYVREWYLHTTVSPPSLQRRRSVSVIAFLVTFSRPVLPSGMWVPTFCWTPVMSPKCCKCRFLATITRRNALNESRLCSGSTFSTSGGQASSSRRSSSSATPKTTTRAVSYRHRPRAAVRCSFGTRYVVCSWAFLKGRNV